MRPDLQAKFNKHVKDVDAVPNYIYHCNAQVIKLLVVTPSSSTLRYVMGFWWYIKE